MYQAQLGDRVHVEYSRVPKQSAATNIRFDRRSCEFTVGGSEVFPALSLGVVGMTPGHQKRLRLQPDEAYGKVHRRLIRQVPRARFPTHMVLEVGKRLISDGGNGGHRQQVTVVEVNLDSVLVDGNHPLAG